MRSKLLIALGAALLGVGAGWLIGRAPAPKPTDPDAGAKAQEPSEAKVPQPPKSPGNGSGARTQIPLSTIYCLTSQEGLRTLPRERDEEFAVLCEKMDRRLGKIGSQAAILVQSATIYAAVEDSMTTLDGGGAPGRLRLNPEFGDKSVWLFVFLGNYLDCDELFLRSVQRGPQELIIEFEQAVHPETTRQSFSYGYWIPLGSVEIGEFTVRAIERGTRYEPFVLRFRITENLTR